MSTIQNPHSLEILLPVRFDTEAVETLLARVEAVRPDTTIRFRAPEKYVLEPFAAVCLLVLAETIGAKLTRFDLPRNAIIPPTNVKDSNDIHGIIEHLHTPRAAASLTSKLRFSAADHMGMAMLVSELLNNSNEHSGTHAWIAMWMKSPSVLQIAVGDGGRGFADSLGVLSDAYALEAATGFGRSVFLDPGRGQGFKQIKRKISRWGGRLLVRSGDAVVEGPLPSGANHHILTSGLPRLQGTQVLVEIPAPENSTKK